MPKLISTKGARDSFVPDDQADQVSSMVGSGDWKLADGETASYVDAYGHQTVVDHGVIEQDRARGVEGKLEDQGTVVKRAREQRLEGETSTLGSAVRGGLSMGSFGLTDDMFDEETIEADKLHHGVARGIGEAVVGVGSLFVGPGGLVRAGRIAEEAGIAGAIARDAVSTERVAGSLSSKFLYAGETGVGHAGAALERGLAQAGEHVNTLKAAAQVPADLARLDKAGLRAAREGELNRLATTHTADRAAAKASAVDDVVAYQTQFKQANPYLVTGEGPASASFAKSSRSLRNAMDDVEGLRENPASLLKPLRQQAQAYEKTIAQREAIASKLEGVNQKIVADLGKELQLLPEAATHVELTGKAARRYAAYADVKLSGKTATLSVARADAQGFIGAIHSGEVMGSSQQALSKLDGLLEANLGLQAKLKAAVAPGLGRAELASPHLAAINAADDVLSMPGHKSLGEDMLSGTIMGHVAGAFSGLPIIGPMFGAKAGKIASDLVFGRMGQTAAAAGERTKVAVDAFLNVAKRGATSMGAPVLASQVLARVAYGSSSSSKADRKAAASLPSAFKARTDEIKAQTAYGPDGTPQMRPEARAAMAARLAPIRSESPVLADRIETLAAKRLEYLSSIIPRRPDINGMQLGPDNWQPSDLQMRSFARSMAAAEDPHGVEERLASGQVTPEDADAYKAVNPERFAALQQTIMMGLPQLHASLPYARRLSLSIFSGIAVDPSLDPRILKVLQAQYQAEEGTEGGTEAPKPKPAFGSVRADPTTPAQRRDGGMA